MIHVERVLEIQASPTAIWSVIGRFMHVDEFAPFVTSVDALTEGDAGVGSKRRCIFDNGSSLIEEVTTWEPNREFRVVASELDPMPLNEMRAGLFIDALDESQSRVTWSVEYQAKYGPLGWILGQTLMKRMMGKVLDASLQGLAGKVRLNHVPVAKSA